MTDTAKEYKWSQMKENRAINREIIDGFIEKKHCTLLTNKKFDCSKLNDYELRKGEEKQCHCADFVNCPAFNQYMSHEILRRRRKTDTINQPNENQDGQD